MAPTQSLVPPTSILRNLANFPPCIYGDLFTSFTFDSLSFEAYAKEIEGIKEDVRRMLLDRTTNSADKIEMIDSLCRLGMSYLFAKEIDDQLQNILNILKFDNHEEHDLYATALHFRVFRQHGYNMSCNIFVKFLNEKGKFKESFASDTKGLLSLYEASQLRIRGEDVLEEAIVFTTTNLSQLTITNSSPVHEKQVTRALGQSSHKGIPRVESRIYISMYEEGKSIRKNLILKLAKLDFNMVQQIHQQELCIISKWWKDLRFQSKLPYSRDRVAECYLFVFATYFEPCFSSTRLMLVKILLLSIVLDDTYDAYGTIEELQLLTEAIDRWDMGCINTLPDYMKFLYGAILNLFDEVREEFKGDGKSLGLYHTIEAMKELCSSNLCQAKWFKNGYVPTLQEYTSIAYGTSTVYLLAVAGYMAMGDNFATKETFEWITGRPKILKSAETIGRLSNDIAGSYVEQKRGHEASSVECYMNEFRVCREVAIEALQEMIESAWKVINEECLNPGVVEMSVLMRVVNIARYVDVVYKQVDGFTNPEVLKDCIASVFLEPIPV